MENKQNKLKFDKVNELDVKGVRTLCGKKQIECAELLNITLYSYQRKEYGEYAFSVGDTLKLYCFFNTELEKIGVSISPIDFFYIIARNNEKNSV